MVLASLVDMAGILATSIWSVGGIMVSIAAFQAVDPGSIPGRRSHFSISKIFKFLLGKGPLMEILDI